MDNIWYFINDNPLEQQIFAKALGDLCPETLCVTPPTGEEALDLMKGNRNLIPDYIVIELKLEGMGAVQFLRQIKKIKRLKDIPVIVHSSKPKPRKIDLLRESGAAAIYFKEYEYFGICNMLILYFNSELFMHSWN